MPVVLVPVHFDRTVENKIQPSCQRSIVIRTFITADFMTGVAAIPGQDIPVKVRYACLKFSHFGNSFISGIA